MQSRPRTATEAKAPPLGAELGRVSAASGVSRTAAIARAAPIEATGSRSARWRLRTIGADRVAAGGDEDAGDADQLAGRAGDVDPDQRRYPGEAEEEPGEAARG